ncbi:hypothetical protein AB6A40_010619 [Gnathostoma spinigerum]|uniref:T-box domain-containing protein n=1 Tax=Gnathostoma spinigerum TaxID=75299 RepID=A0ABD6F3L0_9BILA
MEKCGVKRELATDCPLDLVTVKRSRFMIDRILDEGDPDDDGECGGGDGDGGDGSVEGSVEEVTQRQSTGEHSLSTHRDDAVECTESTASPPSNLDLIPKTLPVPGNSHSLRRLECRLEGRELWSKFYELSTEMIITKSGR